MPPIQVTSVSSASVSQEPATPQHVQRAPRVRFGSACAASDLEALLSRFEETLPGGAATRIYLRQRSPNSPAARRGRLGGPEMHQALPKQPEIPEQP